MAETLGIVVATLQLTGYLSLAIGKGNDVIDFMKHEDDLLKDLRDDVADFEKVMTPYRSTSKLIWISL